jgi:L-asparagine transporter-like permease
MTGEDACSARMASTDPTLASTLDRKLDVFSKEETKYGGKYRDHLLEQYKIYVEMADNVSSRRQRANEFFLTVNTLLLSGLGIVFSGATDFKPESSLAPTLPAMAGILFGLAWAMLLRSYLKLSEAKFCIINTIELELPISPYRAEWKYVGEGKDPKKYVPMTVIEKYVPWFFIILYVSSFFLAIALFYSSNV